MMKADREDLIRANGCVATVTIDHIEKTILDRIPERDVETPAGHLRHLPEEYRSINVTRLVSDVFHNTQCVVPERLNLDRLPVSGVTTQSPTLASIHVSCTPGSPQESKPSLVYLDPVSGSSQMPIDDSISCG